MGLISAVTQAAITKRSDQTINDVLKDNWTITDPAVADVTFGKFWEISDDNNTILTWEQPVNIEAVGVGGKMYDYKIKNQIDVTVKNPDNIGYPPNLAKMVMHCEDIITSQILSGVRPHGYHSMILTGHQYIRNPDIRDKAICVIFVDMNVRCTNV